MTAPRRAMLFLDRDGTLMEDVGYPNDPAQVQLIPGAAETVRELVQLGFVPAVVSNQSGVARGLITRDEVAAVHSRFVELFAAESGVLLPCYYCLHGPEDGCYCRKPKPGLLWQAAVDQKLFGEPGVVVGDKPSDVEAGGVLGYPGILFDLNQSLAPLESSWEFALAHDWREVRAIAERQLACQIGVVE